MQYNAYLAFSSDEHLVDLCLAGLGEGLWFLSLHDNRDLELTTTVPGNICIVQ